MAPRRLLFCLDESKQSVRALEWTLLHLRRASDELHLVTVLPPLTYNVYPVAPVATGAAVAAVTHQWEAQRRAEEHQAAEVLKAAVDLICTQHNKVPRDLVHTKALPAAGGASGVAESLVEYARTYLIELAVVGCRGMGAFQRSLMSFIGLGSVSDHSCHHMPCPTLVVRGEDAVLSRGLMQADEAHPPQSAQPKRVMVCCDDSPHAHAALLWALDNTLLPNDHLVLAAVATPVPFPVLDEPATVAAMQSAQYREAAEAATAAAQDVAERCAAAAQRRGVGKTKITTVALPPGGSSGDVGAALCKHAKSEGVDLMVAGSRGMGAITRSLLGLVGMGSISDFLAHNSPCPLVVVKGVAGGGDDGSVVVSGRHGDLAAEGHGGHPALAPMGSTLRPITEGDGSEASSMQ
ncbi:hypothetical protein Vretimale_9891 [Volvox reticuliferus]|uniref:UspA domain-containing protein n=1 Tax=Volvox reticuliferus TaxID=1737510 RepID=A0A8J4GEF5_9CHLO|nr:hypothetical protein Vretifemale_13715 [Volvox reticuliferus]GIM05455.1 hypothetical protein Vretimale_9891 [Volvox reticuliferus]